VKPVLKSLSSIELNDGAEITAFSKESALAFVINGAGSLDIVDFRSFKRPVVTTTLSLKGSANSVAVNDQGIVAVASVVDSNNSGIVEFFKIKDNRSVIKKGEVNVGNLPDSLAFTPDGKTLVVANEGEPNKFYGTPNGSDPAGSISIIKIDDSDPDKSTVKNLDFSQYKVGQLRNMGVRISGIKGTTSEIGIEPEYVTINSKGDRAFVTLQENNAIAVVDLKSRRISDIFPAGSQEYATSGDFDTSDEDGGYKPGKRNFYGLRMPDGIDTFETGGESYFITANEGDSRIRPDDVNFIAPETRTYYYSKNSSGDAVSSFPDPITGNTIYVRTDSQAARGSFSAEEEDEFFITLKYGAVSDDQFYSDEIRAGDLQVASMNKIITGTDEGRLKLVKDMNTTKKIYAFGGRSFTIYDSVTGNVVYDSGDRLDKIANRAGLYDDGRSDDKSIEPESVITARLGDRKLAFIALERTTQSLVTVFDITKASKPDFIGQLQAPGSLSPEGLEFIQKNSNSGYLLVSNEVSGTLDTFKISI
jgi:DNA-binding beta-propeller fold protein YncE